MLEHKLLASATVYCKNGEHFKIALVVTPDNFVIANHYHGKNDSWGSGDYYPIDTPIEDMYLIYAKRLLAERKSIFTDYIMD